MIVKFKDQILKLKQVRSGVIKEGLKLGVKKLDEHFRFKYGNFNVILGHANVGKTTTVLYLMLLYSIKHKVKWLVFSSENEPYTIIRKLIEYIIGKPLNIIAEKELDYFSEWLYKYFKFIDTNHLYTYKDLLKVAEEVKSEWNFDGLLIDPYNSLIKNTSSMNSHEYDYKACSEFRIFCKKNNITIWLNTHASTEALRKRHSMNHNYAEHPIPPMASDVEGGGKFVNRADDFIVIHRYTQHPTEWMFSHIHIRKVKDVDTGGRPTSLDEPIRLRSVRNNVGFEISEINPILDLEEFKVKKLPF